jgi:hypothetical protein
MRRLPLPDQRRNQLVKPKKIFLRKRKALPGFAKKRSICLMSATAVVNLFSQRARWSLATSIADIGRLQMTRTDFFLKIRAMGIAQSAATAELELLG